MPFKHQMSWKHHYIRQGKETKPPQGMVSINMDLEEIMDDLLELMHANFINLVYLFMPVLFHKNFCSASQKAVTKKHKLQWKRREKCRMEEK